ncbi:ABC-type transport auxiliary lipoprotein family protein [Fodinicurvata halophila]|uniref:ABC-type transport auxiliary lipoprotein family protein n=1 Tax=Fodinicurvata halophila TaxID=1419723 RepID=A0ABV8UFZ0_9PROT
MNWGYYSRRGLLGAGLLGGAGLLAGCGSLIQSVERDAPRLYRLSPEVKLPSDLPRVDWHLVVADVESSSALDSLRIQLLQSPLQVEYFARANWTSRLPEMIAKQMLIAFENSGKVLNVGRESMVGSPDYRLRTEVRDFQAEYFDGAPPVIHVNLAQRLIDLRGNSVVAVKQFQAREEADRDSMDEIVRTFDRAFGKVLGEIVAWTLRNGETAYRSAASSQNS